MSVFDPGLGVGLIGYTTEGLNVIEIHLHFLGCRRNLTEFDIHRTLWNKFADISHLEWPEKLRDNLFTRSCNNRQKQDKIKPVM